ncbi:MAG: AAA family ATPase [Deltaproteobacteria bacterium]
MNYITNVVIENFQSHEKSKLEFINGLNVIVGPSDQGKSAVIRAIKWVLFNEPRGNEFIRNGANFARVDLEFNNGYRIIRERSSSKNRYTIIDIKGETKVFEGFGNEVPEEVKAVHGIYKVLIDSDSSVCLNIGEQLEAPFLVSETGSTKAKAIGRLTGVHVLDNAMRECASDIKRESQLLVKYKKEKNELLEKLDSFKDLDQIEKKINKCEVILKRINGLNEKLDKIEKYKLEYEKINDEINELNKIIKGLENVNRVEKVVNLLLNKIGIMAKLEVLNKKYLDISDEIKITESILSKARNIKTANELFEKVIQLQRRKEDICKLNISYNNIKRSMLEGEKYIINLKEEIKANLKSYNNLLKAISKCPVCFSNIDEETIKRVIEQYEFE